MIKLNENEQKDIVEYYEKLIAEQLYDNKILFNEKLPEYWERHLGVYSSKVAADFPFPGSANCHIPWAAFSDTALESRFVAGVHSSEKLVSVDGTTTGTRESSQKITNTFNNKLTKSMNLYNLICDLFQGLVVEGTRFLKIYPKQVEKTVWRYQALRKIVEGVTSFLGYDIEQGTNKLLQSKKTIKYTTVQWDDISVRDLVWEKGAKTLQDAQWVAHRLNLNTYQIKKMKWENIDKLPKDISKAKSDETELVVSEHIGTMSAEQQLDHNKVSIWEVWGAYPFKTGKIDSNGDEIVEEREMQFVIDIQNKIYLYGDNNGFFDKRKPFVSIPCYRIAGQIRGQSLPQRIGLLNDELDATHNITIDNGTLCNALTLLYVPNKGFDPERIKVKPGAAIKVASVEGVVKQWVLGNPNLDLYRTQSFLINLLEKMGMVTDYSMGKEAIERPTVRGTMALLREFNINVNFLLKNIQNGLTQAVKMTFQTLYEFMPQAGISSINEEKEETLKREDLEDLDDMTITVLADAIRAIQNIELEKAAALLERLGNDQTGEINTAAIKKNFVDKVDHKMVKEVVRDPKEIQQIQQAQQMIAQKLQELQQREQHLVAEEGMSKAREYDEQLKAQGLSEEERASKLEEFRKDYIEQNIGGGQ